MIAQNLDHSTGKVTTYVAIFLAGWISCSAYYGTLHLTQKAETLQTVETKVVPKLAAEAKCEHVRADKTTVVAKQAIKGALVDSAPIPSPSAIPKDDCNHPILK